MMLCKVCRKNSWDGAVKIFVENSSSPPAGTQAGRLQLKMKRGSPLCKLLGAEEIGLVLLVDSY